jgi:chemotaxis protein CheZ
MSLTDLSSPLDNVDFDAIEATLLASEAGRRFLADYVERNRSKETTLLLESLKKLEAVACNRPSSGDVEALRHEITALGEAVALTRQGIAALAPYQRASSEPNIDSTDFDAIALATQKATDHITSAAEIIGQISTALREQGADDIQIGTLDQMASNLRNACSHAGGSDRRIEKVMKILEILQDRIVWLAGSKLLANELSPIIADTSET